MNIEDSLGLPRPGVSRFTFEGELEALGDFAHGTTRATGWRRAVAKLLVLLILLPLLVGVVLSLARLITGNL